MSLIVEFGACLNEWKQSKRAPLLERKLAMRKELDRLMETSETAAMAQLRADLATLQKRLDEARKRNGKGNHNMLHNMIHHVSRIRPGEQKASDS